VKAIYREQLSTALDSALSDRLAVHKKQQQQTYLIHAMAISPCE